MLTLKVTIAKQMYNENGKAIYFEESEDEDENPHASFFNMHLLDEEYLDSQPYLDEDPVNGDSLVYA